jgi:hypothetical protein
MKTVCLPRETESVILAEAGGWSGGQVSLLTPALYAQRHLLLILARK